MGKKTYEEIGKIILVSIISILISVMVTRRTLLDGKLDKSEYYRDQIKHDKKHDQDREDLKETREMVKDIWEHLVNGK